MYHSVLSHSPGDQSSWEVQNEHMGAQSVRPVKTSAWFLHIIDGHTGEKLWRSDTKMGPKLWRTWNSIAKSLVGDVQKRLR
jgi:hypothetical protein